MSLEPFIAFLYILHLRKSSKTFASLQQWDKVFIGLLLAIAFLFVIEVVFSAGFIIKWLWHLLMLFIITATFKLPELSRFKTIMLAVLPLAVILLLKDLVKPFTDQFFVSIKNLLNYTFPLAITWLIALSIIWTRQQKALEKERQLRLAEEQQHKIVEARKMELELLVAERTAQLTRQKEELENALVDLQTTQKQLIQSEKMASLGELTAGIAHEIQNPLNFVNNFSEVSVELLDELKDGPLHNLPQAEQEEVEVIINNLTQNLEKINHHGKRADAIVKGMLQHSRSSSAEKEPTDINALVDEYLRLSYHGLRAKDKLFNASIKTNFDENVGAVEVVPQDIGRVFLNLLNNAFYAVTEKKKNLAGTYEPTVSVSTRRLDDAIEIVVKDNGNGIPQVVAEKIFQPFFTTKPTGQGTGLGLSLSYDIIKAHEGEIKVETKEGECTEFTISLPLNIIPDI